MKGYELTSPDVERFGLLHVSGDVVPPEFFRAIKFDNGKPDLLAVLILSNLLYWYRPIKPRDERTDQPLRWRQRFAGAKLNRTYAELAEKYGATSRQVSDACHRLQSLQLIKITYSPNSSGGTFTYFEPVFDSIKNLLKSESRPTPERESDIDPTHVETSVGIRSNVSRDTFKRESHDKERARVEITCKTTTEIKENAPFVLDVSAIWQDVFSEPLGIHRRTVLESESITCEETFRSVLAIWKTNGYSTRNLTGIASRYRDEFAKKSSVSANSSLSIVPLEIPPGLTPGETKRFLEAHVARKRAA